MRIESLVPRFHDAWWIIVTQCHVHFSPYKLYRTSKSVSRRLCISRFINRCETMWWLIGSKDISMMGKLSNSRDVDGSMTFFASIYLAHILPARLLLLFRREITLTLG